MGVTPTRTHVSRARLRQLDEPWVTLFGARRHPVQAVDQRRSLSNLLEVEVNRGHTPQKAIITVVPSALMQAGQTDRVIRTTTTCRSKSSGPDKTVLEKGSTCLNHFQPAESQLPFSRRTRGSVEYLAAVAQTSSTSEANLSSRKCKPLSKALKNVGRCSNGTIGARTLK